MTLTAEQMEKRLREAPRKKVGRVTFTCANCGRNMTRTIWAEAVEIDEDGEIFYDLEHAVGNCRCGAINVVVYQWDGEAELYWIN
ncbi:MAG: hypothetical protein JRD89_01120 [Deltaproteobacteria bacterium]|nr:hypothetical protein [Deltaproteobacteria bacterium]